MRCPECGGECDAEYVDIGVGMQQVNGCRDCEWFEGQETKSRGGERAMGQAFDEKGNVLGEAHGETKREVFDKLNEAHPNAAEMRITSVPKEPAQAPSGSSEPTSTPQGDGDSGSSSDSGSADEADESEL